VFVSIFQCTPITKVWDFTLEGHCIDLKASFIGNAVPNIVTDVLLLILPLRQVWKLVPTLHLRLQLLLIFGLGSLLVSLACHS
jgi:hypothetical protein